MSIIFMSSIDTDKERQKIMQQKKNFQKIYQPQKGKTTNIQQFIGFGMITWNQNMKKSNTSKTILDDYRQLYNV